MFSVEQYDIQTDDISSKTCLGLFKTTLQFIYIKKPTHQLNWSPFKIVTLTYPYTSCVSSLSTPSGVFLSCLLLAPPQIYRDIWQNLYIPSIEYFSVQNFALSITYGICAWGQGAKVHTNKLLILQKRGLRLMFFAKPIDHASLPWFWTPLVVDAWRLSPSCSRFMLTNDVHNYGTRSARLDQTSIIMLNNLERNKWKNHLGELVLWYVTVYLNLLR